VGILLAAVLLGWLGARADLPPGEPPPAWLFRVVIGVGAAMGLTALLLTFFIREVEGWRAPSDEAPERPRAPEGSLVEPSPALTSLRALPRAYWAVLTVLVLFALANSSDTFLLLRASDLGMAPWSVVLVYAACNLTYAAFSYPIGTWSDTTGRWWMIAAGWVVYAAVYMGFGWLGEGETWAIWPLMATYGLHLALTEGVGKALIADVAPPSMRGAAMGMFLAATGVATLAASLFGGWLWDRYGPAATFGFGAVSAVTGLVALALLAMTGRRSAPSRTAAAGG
jgi:MFS family permease